MAGIEPGSWQFWVWANREGNAERVGEALAELGWRRRAPRASASRRDRWYQLVVSSRPIPVAQQTVYGSSLFLEDTADEDACPRGHVRGLNRLSELHIRCSDWDGSDVAATREKHGADRGILRPVPDLLVSQRLYRLMRDAGLKGQYIEVVHFTDP
jgi:hypothetical protein